MNTVINIPLSKRKLIWVITGSILFILLCAFMLLKASWISDSTFKAAFIKFAGAAGIIFFGIILHYGFKKIKDTNFGLSITSEGFIDNSSGISLGLVKWKDIVGFKELNYQGTKNLIVLVKNPEEYVAKSNGFFSKKMIQANNKMFGSPVAMAATSLTINYGQLKEYILTGFSKYSNKQQV